MRELNLHELMFVERNGGADELEIDGEVRYPLIQEHPGVAPITIQHVQEVERRIATYKAAHPGHIAKYPETGVDDPTHDSALCRGEWLGYWLRWAIDNCTQPVFVNS